MILDRSLLGLVHISASSAVACHRGLQGDSDACWCELVLHVLEGNLDRTRSFGTMLAPSNHVSRYRREVFFCPMIDQAEPCRARFLLKLRMIEICKKPCYRTFVLSLGLPSISHCVLIGDSGFAPSAFTNCMSALKDSERRLHRRALEFSN